MSASSFLIAEAGDHAIARLHARRSLRSGSHLRARPQGRAGVSVVRGARPQVAVKKTAGSRLNAFLRNNRRAPWRRRPHGLSGQARQARLSLVRSANVRTLRSRRTSRPTTRGSTGPCLKVRARASTGGNAAVALRACDHGWGVGAQLKATPAQANVIAARWVNPSSGSKRG